MKTIPLNTLVDKISKLAWKRYGGQIRNDLFLVAAGTPNRGKNIPSVTEKANLDYIIHCCNHFPELVAVAREFQTCVQRDWHVPQEICDRMAKILASAETIQIEE